MMSATLSLGLVAIPVGLHATRRREGKVSYHLIHEACGSRVKRQYVCIQEDIPLEDKDLSRAYEGEGDEEAEVILTKEEVEALAPKATGRIDLIEFVPADTIDPVYFDNAYYLSPGKGGDHAYHLLAETLRELGMVGVGTQLARKKSYLIAVRATPLGLVMHTLHHAEEVHAEEDVHKGDRGRLTASERELARTLVAQNQKPAFDPSKFEDEADDALRAAIAAHAKQPERKVAARGGNGKRAQPNKLSDLVASLRASLEAKGEAKDGSHRTRRVARTAAKKPRKRAKPAASRRA